MAKINWSVGDLLSVQDPKVPSRKSYGVVTSPKGCVLLTDIGLRTGRYRISAGPIPTGSVPMVDARNIPFEVRLALEALGVAIGFPNFCTRG